jgi:preprotein translocase subunit SecG
LLIILKVIFVLTCVFLILVILLQSGKGGDVAAAFGGAGSQTAFGPRGAQKPLEKATIIAAAIFMFLALLFSLPGFGSGSVVGEGTPTATPPPASNPAAAPTISASPEASPAASPSPAESPKEGAAAPTKPSPAASPAKK